MSRLQKDQVGLSLVELMIAMVIGLIIIIGVGQIFLSGKQSFNTQSGLGTMQENGRFALFFLQRDIRLAGFPFVNGPSVSQFTPVAFVDALTNNGAGNASDEIQILSHSDPALPNSDEDCLGQESSVIFSGAGCPAANPASRTDDGGAACSWLVTNHYFIQNGTLMCRGIGNAIAQEMVRGVENMQILYGQDLNDDSNADLYRNADQVTNWNSISAVRAALLINSQEQIADTADTQQYAVLDGPVITPADDAATPINELLMRRRVFTSTIEIRNRTRFE